MSRPPQLGDGVEVGLLSTPDDPPLRRLDFFRARYQASLMAYAVWALIVGLREPKPHP